MVFRERNQEYSLKVPLVPVSHIALLKDPTTLKLVITPKKPGEKIMMTAGKFGRKQSGIPKEYSCGNIY